MKKLLVIFALVLLVSCGPRLKPDGTFSSEQFIGKFHNTKIYRVQLPGETTWLYLGVNEKDEVVEAQTFAGKNNTVPVPVIIIDGKKVSKEEAKKLLE